MTHSQPLVSIDVVPLHFNRAGGVLTYGTGKRLFEPFQGKSALPGVLLGSGESIMEAAERALRVKTDLPLGVIRQLGAFDSTNRDPRGATISIALLSVQSDVDASTLATWHSVKYFDHGGISQLPFDHDSIVQAAIERVYQVVWKDVPLTRDLLGEQFTTAQAVALAPPTPLVSNTKRWLSTWPHVQRIESTKKTGQVGRPSTTWEWINNDTHQ